MKRVTVIFATGASWMDFLVTRVTKSRWSHAALRFDADHLLVEALAGRGLSLQPGGKYDGWTTSLAIPLMVPEPVYEAMLLLSRNWAAAKIPYGYGTCVAIGVKALFGERAGRIAVRWLSGERAQTLVCSEMLVTLWRMNVPDFLQGRDPRLVSPDELCQALSKKLQYSQN